MGEHDEDHKELPTRERSKTAAVTRRGFLTVTSVSAAAVGVMGAIPALGAVAESPEVDTSGVPAATLAEPMVAQVTDVTAGEVSVMAGMREVIVRDPQLVGRLLKALHG